MARCKTVDIGYGGRIKGHTPAELNRIEQGVPEHVKHRKDDGIGYIRAFNFPKKLTKDESPGINLSTIPKRNTSRIGKCFELAGRLIIDDGNSRWTLVHATLYPHLGAYADFIYFHAFLQQGNVIFDPVFNVFYDKDEYYRYYDITDVREYSKTAAVKQMLKHKHFGSWE